MQASSIPRERENLFQRGPPRCCSYAIFHQNPVKLFPLWSKGVKSLLECSVVTEVVRKSYFVRLTIAICAQTNLLTYYSKTYTNSWRWLQISKISNWKKGVLSSVWAICTRPFVPFTVLYCSQLTVGTVYTYVILWVLVDTYNLLNLYAMCMPVTIQGKFSTLF